MDDKEGVWARQIGDLVGCLTKKIRNNKEHVGHGKDDQEL